jgi:hypothetical protein
MLQSGSKAAVKQSNTWSCVKLMPQSGSKAAVKRQYSGSKAQQHLELRQAHAVDPSHQEFKRKKALYSAPTCK